MKILHLQGGNLLGGAAKGAYQLHVALRKIGIDSLFLIQHGIEDEVENKTFILNKNKKEKLKMHFFLFLNTLPLRLYKKRKNLIFSTNLFSQGIPKSLLNQADIIHLHWIGNFFSLKDISKIKKPIVFTLRDMWAFTGGCHYALSCQRYIDGCGRCQTLNSFKDFDLSKFLANKKEKCFGKAKLYPVAISSWLKECAKKSKIFKSFDVEVIPNGIDTDLFSPIAKDLAKDILKLPKDRKIILTGSGYIAPWKGYDLFIEALRFLDLKDKLIVFFGKLTKEIYHAIKGLNTQFYSFGFIYDDLLLRIIYSCADVFVCSSLQEAFGKTVIEAMSCQTPVIAFDATGPKDIISHKKDGYLAKAFEAKDLAEGIEWVLNNEKIQTLSREKVKTKFDIKIIAEQYRNLYQKILSLE
jgi:glycosyltransferase involved in cell wall biosynthesis